MRWVAHRILVSVSALSPWDYMGLGWGWALGVRPLGLRVWGKGLTTMITTYLHDIPGEPAHP